MTEKRVDTYQALLAFEHIRTQGKQVNGEYHFEGFTAFTDFDGYTVTISQRDVTLTIFFHNKYDVSFKDAEDLDNFLKQLYNLCGESA